MILKNSILPFLLFLTSILSFNSCSGCFKGGVKSTPKLVNAFAKNAGKNADVVYQATKSGGKIAVQNGRKIAVGKVDEISKIKIPNAKNLKSLTRLKSGQPISVAQKSVKKSEIDLLLYDSAGNPIVYADGSEHRAVYDAARNAYEGKATRIVDDILQQVNQKKITTEKDLEEVIQGVVKKQLKGNPSKSPYVMDVSSGNLTFNVQFESGSQIIGAINIYSTVKKGLAVGTGGYYILPKMKQNEFKPLKKIDAKDLEKNTDQIIKAYGKKDK